MKKGHYHYLKKNDFTLCGKQKLFVDYITNHDETVTCPLCKKELKKYNKQQSRNNE